MDEIFKQILSLTYSEMMELALHLRETSESCDFEDGDDAAWARVLYSAAQAHVDTMPEEPSA
jgi:hypothetical protein